MEPTSVSKGQRPWWFKCAARLAVVGGVIWGVYHLETHYLGVLPNEGAAHALESLAHIVVRVILRE